MYSVGNYGDMIADRVRTKAYLEALERAIEPGCTVLDVGTGTGFFAMMACKFGAGKVYAVETSEVIEVARQSAKINGFGDRIEFVNKTSRKVTLDKLANVIIADLRGPLPFNGKHLPDINDIRERLLAPGGRLIPRRDTVWAAPVQAPEEYRLYVEIWEDKQFELDLSTEKRIVLNSWSREKIKEDQLLAKPGQFAEINYHAELDANARADLEWKVTRDGTVHGMVLWFDTELVPGVGFSNGPAEPDLIYGKAFFPWLEPVELNAGDDIRAFVDARLVGDDYVWRWNTEVFRGDKVLSQSRQSTFYGMTLSPKRLQKRAAGFVPTINEDGEITRAVLESMQRNVPLKEIAIQVAKQFSVKFKSQSDAMDYVGSLFERYCK
jgi:predicted RNA methylase